MLIKPSLVTACHYRNRTDLCMSVAGKSRTMSVHGMPDPPHPRSRSRMGQRCSRNALSPEPSHGCLQALRNPPIIAWFVVRVVPEV